MRYRCLRDCYVGEHFWQAREVYDLPENMVKDEKNFKLLGGSKDEAPAEKAPEPKTPGVRPEVIPEGFYWCTKCSALHSLGKSAIGKKHLKYEWIPEAPDTGAPAEEGGAL